MLSIGLLFNVLTIIFASFLVTTMAQSTNPAGKPWADQPCPLIKTPQYETKKDDIFTKGATHMALLHNAVLRGFNTIYLQAPHVKDEQEVTDFMGYCLAWHKFVSSHHNDEEGELFPAVEGVLKEKGLWEKTHQEHQSFLGGLSDFETYLGTLDSPYLFSGAELVRIMDSFREPFVNHFHSEIATIASFSTLPNAPAPGSPEADKTAATFKAWGKKTLTKAGITDVVPFCLLNMDATYEDGMWANWPPMPGPIRWMMVNVFGSWNWGWWRYASCYGNGMPRPLYALQGLKEDEADGKKETDKGEL